MNKIQNLLLLLGVIAFCFNGKALQPEKRNYDQPEKINILVLTEQGGQHESFTGAALQWLAAEKVKLNIEWTEINNTKPINDEYLKQFELIIQLDYPPYSWTKEAENAFIDYIDEGLGWLGRVSSCHAAGRIRRLPDVELVLRIYGKHPV